jgi:WD40 repeat protein
MGPIHAVVFSPGDGRLLAAAGDNATATLWEVATGHTVGPPLTGHTGFVSGIAFTPDGTRLATGGADGMHVGPERCRRRRVPVRATQEGHGDVVCTSARLIAWWFVDHTGGRVGWGRRGL